MHKVFLPVVMQSSCWHDEFDGDLSRWLIADESYDPDYHLPRNVTIENGNLVITAKREPYGFMGYTTGWIESRVSWTYGRFEARIKLPVGKGLWPAFWLRPASYKYGDGVASGELDILELYGHIPGQIKGTIHYGYPWKYIETPYNNGNFSEDYHLFALEWQPRSIRWFVDGVLYKTETEWYTSGGKYPAPFDQPFHIVLNVGIWRYVPPDANTVFPVSMYVDYVRVVL